MTTKKSEDFSKEGVERKRLVQELKQLETTHKSGILSAQEFTAAKRSLEKKIQAIEQKIKQQEAKKKAVEEILGAQSVLQPSAAKKKHVKYFTPVEAVLRKEKAVSKKEKKEETVLEKQNVEVEIIPQDPVASEYKEIETLVEQNDTNWRFALALLTVFLLILLYVKFVSFGGATDIVSLDVYLDYASPYSHEMYATITDVLTERSETIYVTYHLLGVSEQSALAGYGVLCAASQERQEEFVSYLFTQDTVVLDNTILTDLARMLDLDTEQFASCLTAETTEALYAQEQAAAEDISYTPTIIINDKKIVGAVSAATLSEILDTEITKLG